MQDNSSIPPPTSSYRPQAHRNPRRRMYIGLGIGVALLVLAGLITLGVKGVRLMAGTVKKPAEALTLFTDALIREDYQGAYNLASPELRANLSLDDMVQHHANLTAKLGALKSVKQTDLHMEANEQIILCSIHADFQFERGNRPFLVTLRKQDGIWRVVRYRQLPGE